VTYRKKKHLPTIRKIPDELWDEIKIILPPKQSASYESPLAALSVGIHNLSPSQSITLDQYSGAQTNFIKEQAGILESTTITLKDNYL
jgi:hypothetical protein